jgi:hypothetical protein
VRFQTDHNDVMTYRVVLAAVGLTAHIDSRGRRWGLGEWAETHTTTYGRHASSRGIAHRVGEGGTVTITVGKCGWCGSHAGEAVIGRDPLPPFHPSCSCVAVRARRR